MPQLPIYEKQLRLQPFGQISYENLQYEIRSSQGLDRALDKLSEWALGKMESKAKAEAAQYALDNPPNAAELHKLTTDFLGADPNKQQEKLNLLQRATQGMARPENVREGTIFAEEFAKARTLQIKASLSAMGQEIMAMYSSQVESGVDADNNPINIDDIRRNINARVNGLTSAMAGVDQKAAAVLNGELLSYADKTYTKALAASSAAAVARESVKIDRYIQNSANMLNDALGAAGADGQVNGVDVAEVADLMSDNIMANVIAMAQVNPELLKTSFGKTMKEMQRVKIDAMTSYFGSTEFAPDVLLAAKRLRDGDAGKMVGLYGALPTDGDRDEIIKKLFAREAANIEMSNKMEAVQAATNRKEFAKLYPAYLAETDPAKKNKLAATLVPIAPTLEMAEKLISPSNREDNYQLRAYIETKLLRNRLTGYDFILSNRANLSDNDVRHLMTVYAATEEKDQEAAIKLLREASSVDDIFNTSGDERRKNALTYEAWLRQFRTRVANTKPGEQVDYMGIAIGIVEPHKKEAKPDNKEALLGKVNKEAVANRIKFQSSIFSNRNQYQAAKKFLSPALQKEIETAYPGLK